MASPMILEIGMTIIALGVLLYFLAGFVSGEILAMTIVLVVAGVLRTVMGFAIGRRDDRG